MGEWTYHAVMAARLRWAAHGDTPRSWNRTCLPVLVLLMLTLPPLSGCGGGPATDNRSRWQESELGAARAGWRWQENELNGIWIGRRLAYLGRYDEAIDWYRQLLQRWPQSHRVRRHLGHRLLSTRQFVEARAVLEEAHTLAADQPNRLEMDGAPNSLGVPLSTTHGNISYHLALACYLLDDFESAALHWQEYLDRWAANDDSRAAGSHWLHTTLIRLGRTEDAAAVIAALPPEPWEVIENRSYADLCRLYSGRLSLSDFAADGEGAAAAAGQYGLARWHLHQGNQEEGTLLLQQLTADPSWPSNVSFAFLAAEVDLASMALETTE